MLHPSYHDLMSTVNSEVEKEEAAEAEARKAQAEAEKAAMVEEVMSFEEED